MNKHTTASARNTRGLEHRLKKTQTLQKNRIQKSEYYDFIHGHGMRHAINERELKKKNKFAFY
jgi:hypothetical protein